MKTARSPRKTRNLPKLVRLVTPTGAIDTAWPEPGSNEVAQFQQLAMRWTNVVRNRARWVGVPSLADQQDLNARKFLELAGISERQRQEIADAGAVRVEIPFTVEDQRWEARILPWEFLLSAGTRDLRQGPLVVTRSLIQAEGSGNTAYKKVLFVESAPGALENKWDFEDERRLVEKYSRASKFEPLPTPTRAALKKVIAAFSPDVIHLAGFDSHQGLELLGGSVPDTADGYLLASDGAADPVEVSSLAAILTAGKTKPSLVFCNFWNSAARIAPMLVAAGVDAVIGFQDSMDDALAEMFVGNFYRGLSELNDPEHAFSLAWQSLQMQRKPLRGSGIALWRNGVAKPALTSRSATATGKEQFKVASSVTADKARELLLVAIEPVREISYSLLHNNRDLFQKFMLTNLSDATITGVEVFVELHSNEGTYPYRQTVSVEGAARDMTREIRIALTSQLARTLGEVLRTSLYVEIKWGAHEIIRQTFPVTLAPVDQWADTDADRIFLPSFIFPRDKAVASIVKNAEQFMTVLRDDPAAGFDGYQSIDPELTNPAQYVDNQVQALWYSAVYKVPASYINPPPTYAESSQRIRTPSEIVRVGFGTCIDLALMFAACLEAIEVHPVIFLLEDHAFPGYWRTDTAREAFCERVASRSPGNDSSETAIRGTGAAARTRPGAQWCYDKKVFAEIKRAIDRRQLVPLETVGLTGRSSLTQSAADALEYFEPEEANRFLMMLDVMTAREWVTPLPLGDRLE